MKTLKTLTFVFALLTVSLSMANSTTTIADDIVYFAGQSNETSNTLNYVSFKPVKNDLYFLEKSYDGVNFFKVENAINDKDEKASNKHALIDNTPNNITYYRLVEKGVEGKFAFSHTIVVLNNNILTRPALADTLRD